MHASEHSIQRGQTQVERIYISRKVFSNSVRASSQKEWLSRKKGPRFIPRVSWELSPTHLRHILRARTSTQIKEACLTSLRSFLAAFFSEKCVKEKKVCLFVDYWREQDFFSGYRAVADTAHLSYLFAMSF